MLHKQAGRTEEQVGGIDVGKTTLQVALMPGPDATTVAKAPLGGAKLARWRGRRGVTHLVREATTT